MASEIDRRLAASEIALGFLNSDEIIDRFRYRQLGKLFHEKRFLLFPEPGGIDEISDMELRTKFAGDLAIQVCPEGAKADDKWRYIWINLNKAGKDN
jgi:hypothetical protein